MRFVEHHSQSGDGEVSVIEFLEHGLYTAVGEIKDVVRRRTE